MCTTTKIHLLSNAEVYNIYIKIQRQTRKRIREQQKLNILNNTKYIKSIET